MKIVGIDPGIARTGWGIIDNSSGNWKVVECACIETDKHDSLEKRLLSLYDQLQSVMKREKPNQAAVESLFFNTNAKTALTVGHARGVTLLAITRANVPLSHYTPLQVKIAMTGYGRADKNQMQQMIKTLLNLETIPKPDDIADALCVALTHAYTNKGLKQ